MRYVLTVEMDRPLTVTEQEVLTGMLSTNGYKVITFGPAVFNPSMFFMASCNVCDLKIPFGNARTRDNWVAEHEQAKHWEPGDVQVSTWEE